MGWGEWLLTKMSSLNVGLWSILILIIGVAGGRLITLSWLRLIMTTKVYISYTKTISTAQLSISDLKMLVGVKDANLILEQAHKEFLEFYRQKLISYLGDYVVVPKDF